MLLMLIVIWAVLSSASLPVIWTVRVWLSLVSKFKPTFATWICPVLLILKNPSLLPTVMAKVAIVPEVTRGSPMLVFMAEFSLTDRAWLPMVMSFSKTLLMVTVRVFWHQLCRFF